MENSSEVEILPTDHPSFDFSFKIIIIGNSAVGKSCLTEMGIRKKFTISTLSTIGFDCQNFHMKYKDKVIRLIIWDTCGQEEFRSLITSFFRGASLAFIVYAINDQKSFASIEEWANQVRTHSTPNTSVFLIGNKCDLTEERVIETEQGESLKQNCNFEKFLETSAKTGFNAQEIFVQAGILLAERNFAKLKEHSTIDQDLLNDVHKKLNNKKQRKKKKKENACCG